MHASLLPPLLFALGILFLEGCATQARLAIYSDPPGAEVTELGSSTDFGRAPIIVAYDKRALLNGARTANGCYLVKGFEAEWPSGARTQYGPVSICGNATGSYSITIVRKSSDPDSSVDLDYARRFEESQRQQQAAAAAAAAEAARKSEATQRELTQLALQAALIPAAHNLAPTNRRDAIVQALAASAATNATLFIDQDGLALALSNPTPEDAISAAQIQDTRIMSSFRESPDSAGMNRISAIVDRLLPRLHHKEGQFTVRVLESDQVNAFTTGGRFIYVYTGLLSSVADDDELAGILAHELAHIDAGHIGRSANQLGWMGLGALVAYVTVNRNDRHQVADGFRGGRATFSREYESEADILGTIYARRAGYSGRGLANFFDRHAATTGGTQISPWLIDHPFDLERRARVLAVLDNFENGSPLYDPISTKALQTLGTVEDK